MAVIALGVLEPANLAVLVEMRKARPDGDIIAQLMKRLMSVPSRVVAWPSMTCGAGSSCLR